VLADDPLRAGERGDEADLQFLLGERRSGGEAGDGEPDEQCTERDTHDFLLEFWIAAAPLTERGQRCC
jgi:hypothetical protein